MKRREQNNLLTRRAVDPGDSIKYNTLLDFPRVQLNKGLYGRILEITYGAENSFGTGHLLGVAGDQVYEHSGAREQDPIEMAQAAWEAGASYVILNPADAILVRQKFSNPMEHRIMIKLDSLSFFDRAAGASMHTSWVNARIESDIRELMEAVNPVAVGITLNLLGRAGNHWQTPILDTVRFIRRQYPEIITQAWVYNEGEKDVFKEVHKASYAATYAAISSLASVAWDATHGQLFDVFKIRDLKILWEEAKRAEYWKALGEFDGGHLAGRAEVEREAFKTAKGDPALVERFLLADLVNYLAEREVLLAVAGGPSAPTDEFLRALIIGNEAGTGGSMVGRNTIVDEPDRADRFYALYMANRAFARPKPE
ncbi:MAG: hypothetical protein AABZ57_01350, partial [Candidatus Margulisiibacteriota bacterium]